ncbi:MAG: universal stress protein [Deltaproteobacteria bacterium]|nr:universal stress protein [Deltaproteobacteria bacterium]
MFKHILFATSATEACDHAARVAFNLAREFGSDLTVFHVMGIPTRGFSRTMVDVRTREKVEPDEEYSAWVCEEIKTHYSRELEKVPGCDVCVAVGYPHREILRQAREKRPDLIVMGGTTGSDEDSPYRKILPGSTMLRVARAAPCPVMVVARPAASFWGGISSIVFGTDFSKASDAAFDYARELSAFVKGELHVFHAVDIQKEGIFLAQDMVDARLREAVNRMRGRYGSRMEGVDNWSVDAWEGFPPVEIVKYAREKHADAIVMAHHTRTETEEETRGVTLGSVLEQVIMRASCPVISVNRHRKTG